jgi:hypothetical protein
MKKIPSAAAEVFTAHEIARASGVSVRAVRELLDSGQVPLLPGGYVAAKQAVKCVRVLRGETVAPERRELFAPPKYGERSPGAGIAGSTLLHASLLAGLIVMTSFGLTATEEQTPKLLTPTRMVFLATPGPGGGGGGGGLKQPKPPAKAEMKLKTAMKSPVPPPKPLTTKKPDPERVVPPPPPVVQPVAKPVEPPPPRCVPR